DTLSFYKYLICNRDRSKDTPSCTVVVGLLLKDFFTLGNGLIKEYWSICIQNEFNLLQK
ncbi:MAG: hypothetical protein ACI8ZQ_001407, partial [Bacteroidia bacterium]